MKLIVGLGNPGDEHKDTRHNAGFKALEALICFASLNKYNYQLPIFNYDKKTNCEISKGAIKKKRVLLAKPQTFMNNSGLAVKALLNFYKLKPENLIVIHDDKDVPLGETRVQKNKGPAGHNGVRSVIEQLGTQNFTRIRVGIGLSSPPARGGVRGGGSDTATFVLGKFTKEEKKTLEKVLINVIKEVEQLI